MASPIVYNVRNVMQRPWTTLATGWGIAMVVVIVGQRISRRFAILAVGDQIRFGQQAFAVVGLFTAAGSAFESEVWGDNAVLMPAFDRTDAFQSVTFRMRRPAAFDELKRPFEG